MVYGLTDDYNPPSKWVNELEDKRRLKEIDRLNDIERKTKELIDKCFKIANGGWNQKEDEKVFKEKAMKYAKQINLID